MSVDSLASLDANLLFTLNTLLEERSVTRAAERCGITQPAMSHALRRLRDTLHDELMVRKGRGMAPTPRAQQIEAELNVAMHALDDIGVVLRDAPVEALPRAYRLIATEHAELTAAQPTLRWSVAGGSAPVLAVRRPGPGSEWAVALREGAADFAIGTFVEPVDGLEVHALPPEPLALLVAHDHELLDLEGLDVDHELAYVQVAEVGSSQIAALRVAVADRGAALRCVFTTTSYHAAARAAAETSAAAIMPLGLATQFAAGMPVRAIPLRGEAFEVPMSVAWRSSGPPVGAEWFATLLARGARSTAARIRPLGRVKSTGGRRRRRKKASA